MNRRFVLRLVAAVMSLSGATATHAQAYPDKPVRFVVGFPPGSTIDVVSRVVLDDIRNRTGATIVVENKPGALGAIGLTSVAQAPADGYTLMPSSSATHSSGPSLNKVLQRLDPVRNLAHVARLVKFDIAVVTAASGPYKDAKSLVEAGKSRPGDLTFGFGSGTGQIGGDAFARAAGMKVRGIPYKGQPAAITDLLGGQVDFVASDLGAIMGYIKHGSLAPIVLLSDKRSSFLPDVPTAHEAGLGEIVLSGWIGIDGPIGLPPEVLSWWERELHATMGSTAVQEKLHSLSMESDLLTGEALKTFVQTERERWAGHAKAAGLNPE